MPSVRQITALARPSAVLFDLDGTLYRQAPLRRLMALELLTLPLGGPVRAPRRFRALSAFRHAQEALRSRGASRGGGSLAAAQVAAAAQASGLPETEVAGLVQEWMQERPLKYLLRVRAAGLLALLDYLDVAGIRVGVLSDYPAEAKLQALGLAGRFAPVLCTTDPEIGALKPHPRGFLRACEIWRLAPREVLMVGDRADADAAGAASAGMPCVIVGGRNGADRPYMTVPSFERLQRVLEHGR
jgi:HAD superfamily hydrolase (TIGR01549 family)